MGSVLEFCSQLLPSDILCLLITLDFSFLAKICEFCVFLLDFILMSAYPIFVVILRKKVKNFKKGGN